MAKLPAIPRSIGGSIIINIAGSSINIAGSSDGKDGKLLIDGTLLKEGLKEIDGLPLTEGGLLTGGVVFIDGMMLKEGLGETEEMSLRRLAASSVTAVCKSARLAPSLLLVVRDASPFFTIPISPSSAIV
jgi:hypothetical protein